MAKRVRKRRCRHCHLFFPPDPRNAWHQHYCDRPECRKASKAESQKKWLAKEEGHFRGPANVLRVQEWRKAHPGYWRKPAGEDPPKTPSPQPSGEKPLQDLLTQKQEEDPAVKLSFGSSALQDLFFSQEAVLIGLIAHFTDTALQDDIVLAARRLQQLGLDILSHPTQCKGETNEAPDRTGSIDPRPVQLGGSAPSP